MSNDQTDRLDSLEWYKKSAEQEIRDGINTKKSLERQFIGSRNGYRVSQYNLSRCYEYEIGVEKGEVKEFELYKKAAEQEYGDAQNKLGYFYENAAERNHSNAQYNLTLLYESGEGTVKNLEKVFYWHQETTENCGIISKNSSNNKLYKKCKQPYVNYHWCQYNVQSGPIEEYNINYHDKSRFSEIHKAI
ncbi:hypothetical protein C1645_820337 [Glomus cerebriforme]|uniref:Sel1 repeat family protein n=1 Tax=Glomus cerebriforme TaxID=658196 RepID=A0A397T5S9_9GLOM|nr:hypothetical protein C1645_820337 [Glomus cerebriforme]